MKTMAKEHGALVMNQNPPGVWAVDASLSQGWRLLSPAGVAVSDTYFDFGGLTHDYKTLMFEGATVQEILAPINFGGAVGDSLILCDVMSSSPMSDNELLNFYVYGNFAQRGSLTFDQTIYARIRQFNVDVDNAAWGSMIQLTDNQIGSLDPTASDRVYCYRLVAFGTPFNGNRVDLLPARYLLKASIKEEAEYEYLMRLKRSYELQQTSDRD
jgi:hypothetical protein